MVYFDASVCMWENKQKCISTFRKKKTMDRRRKVSTESASHSVISLSMRRIYISNSIFHLPLKSYIFRTQTFKVNKIHCKMNDIAVCANKKQDLQNSSFQFNYHVCLRRDNFLPLRAYLRKVHGN